MFMSYDPICHFNGEPAPPELLAKLDSLAIQAVTGPEVIIERQKAYGMSAGYCLMTLTTVSEEGDSIIRTDEELVRSRNRSHIRR